MQKIISHAKKAHKVMHAILTQSISHPHKSTRGVKRHINQHLENLHHVTASWMLAGLIGIYSFLGASFVRDEVFATTSSLSDVPTRVTGLVGYHSGNVQLSWNAAKVSDPSYPVLDYIVIYKKSSATRYSLYNDGVSTRTSAQISLPTGSVYDFRVAAKNARTIGRYSAKVQVSLSSPDVPSPVPTPTYTYSWTTASWLACSATCGGGTQTRSVTCTRNDGVTVADSSCTTTKPSTSQACNTTACASAPTPTPVNGTCGTSNKQSFTTAPTTGLCTLGTASGVTTGTSTFTWSCRGLNNGTTASCSATRTVAPPPAPTYTYSWTTASWSACSATCGGGTQTRSVTCTRNDGVTVADSSCTTTKPSTSQACNTTACATTVIAPTSAYTRIADEGNTFTLSSTQLVKYGATGGWAERTLSAGTHTCSNATFLTDPLDGVVKGCFAIVSSTSTTPVNGSCGTATNQSFTSAPTTGLCALGTASPVTTLTSSFSWTCAGTNGGTPANCSALQTAHVHTSVGAPVINNALIPGPTTESFSSQRVRATSEMTIDSDIGAFRTVCGYSHMNYDDPIVYPGQPGRAHLHTFFGNTLVNAFSTANSIATTGNSTCRGGTANRSSYWVPSLIDTTRGAPIRPEEGIFYYKTGYGGVRDQDVQPMPNGLRMISGNARATTPPAVAWESAYEFHCEDANGTHSNYSFSIPNCPAGHIVAAELYFPQCWDGVNLDSANHSSHMAQAVNGCPSSHPVALPQITFNIKWRVPAGVTGSSLRLASDVYSSTMPAGYSMHGDWFNGWDEGRRDSFINNCIKNRRDCFAHLLGDRVAIY